MVGTRKRRALKRAGAAKYRFNPSQLVTRKFIPYLASGIGGGYAFNKLGNYMLRKKSRGPGSNVKTLHQSVKQNGQGGSFSKFFYGKNRVPKRYRSVSRALAKNYYSYNGAQRLGGNVGVQTFAIALSMFNQTDVNAISTKISASKVNKFLLMSCSAEVLMTNQALSNCRYTIYDIVARRDINAANVLDPVQAWGHAYADEGGANADNTVVGATPFSADAFVQFYKVLKMTHGVLAQGQTHVHRVHYSPNRAIDGEYVQYTTYGFKGLTCYTMVVIHGEPQNDSVLTNQVSTGGTAVDIVTRQQYRFTYLQDVDTTWSKTNNLPSAFTNAARIVDIGSGAITNDAAA